MLDNVSARGFQGNLGELNELGIFLSEQISLGKLKRTAILTDHIVAKSKKYKYS